MRRWALALVVMVAGTASGQRLNLQTGGAPPPNAGLAARALADSLDQQIETMKKQPGAGPAARVSMSLRIAARDLLRSGEAAGESGSSRVLLGRTIADHLAALDNRAAEAARAAPLTLDAVAMDLDSPVPPDEVRADRWLRDALAPLTQTVTAPPVMAGWFEAGEDPRGTVEPLVRWSAGLEITDPLRQAVARLDERLRSAELWIAYRPAARRAAALVRVSAGPIERRPAWFTVQARRDLEDRLVEALATFEGDGAAGAEAGQDRAALLRRIANLSGLLERAATVDETSTAVREIRAGLMDLLKLPRAGRDEERRLGTLDRAIGLALRRRELERDADLARQLKPALRGLAPAARESEAALFAAARRLVSDEGAASDPAVLNAVSAHQRRVDDLALVARLNALIAVTGPGGAGVAPEYKGLADWLFEIGQDLAKPARRDLALAEFREVAGGAVAALDSGALRRLVALVDPSTPRSPGPTVLIWNELTGDRAAALADAADKARAALIGAWNAKEVPRRQEAERRARLINRLIAAIEDAAWARSLEIQQQSPTGASNVANLQQWPGWQLSAATLHAVASTAPIAGRAAVERLLAGDDRDAEAQLRTLENDAAVALLAGRLERLATEAGQGTLRAGPDAALLELGLGPPDPDRSWMAGERPALAAICRYAEEWAEASREAGQGDRARAIRNYVNGLAARTLERARAAE